MRHDPAVWHLALQSVKSEVPFALLYVVESLGSSPGRAGFAMGLTDDATAGSIGGGAMEFRFITQTRAALGYSAGPPQVIRQVHDRNDDDASGMICSGEQTVAILVVRPSDRSVLEAILTSLNTGSGGVLSLSSRGLTFDPAGRRSARYRFEPGNEWLYEEDWGSRDRLHLVGGGHCALALSQLASTLDFDISVYDDRPGLPTFAANVYAHRRIPVEDYSSVGQSITAGLDQFVCVMTFGYKTDDLAVRSLLPQDYRFLGVLGSRAKIDKMHAAWAADGLSAERLRRLQAPLGLPIHSQTPAEIAVSIAAQLIRVRNEPLRSVP